MSFLNTKGLNDIQNIATFTQSASSLNLLDENNKNLQKFFKEASTNNLLEKNIISNVSVQNLTDLLKDQGILPVVIPDPIQVTNLINSAKELGVTANNFPEKLTEIVDKAKETGLYLIAKATVKKADEGKAITADRLYFAPYGFKEIHSIKITQGINEHAKLFISGILPEEESIGGKNYVELTEENTAIALNYLNTAKEVKRLFTGLVTNISMKTMAQNRFLEIEAVSYSYLLDIKKHSRSFQCDQNPYDYIFKRVNTVAKKYIPNLSGDIVSANDTEKNKNTEKLILQYHETDWEFLKRLASHFNLGLIPDVLSDTPRIYFGMPPEKQAEQTLEFNASTYKVRRDTLKYMVSKDNWRNNNGSSFSEKDFTFIDAQSWDILELGQSVSFLNKNFFINAISTSLEKGAINSFYTLSTKQGLMQDDRYNNRIVGMSLSGVVKKIEKDKVQVHFDVADKTWIDENWDDSGTWFFPYTSVYTTKDGAGWYCMPEEGDNVRVYFPNNMENNAVATSSINPESEGRGERGDPNSKIISTVHGKKIMLIPDGIQLIAGDKLLMTLSEKDGLTINSDKKIVLQAEEDINITSKGAINVKADSEINLVKGGSSIEISRKVDIKSVKVNIQ